jgi:hypothetical protein
VKNSVNIKNIAQQFFDIFLQLFFQKKIQIFGKNITHTYDSFPTLLTSYSMDVYNTQTGRIFDAKKTPKRRQKDAKKTPKRRQKDAKSAPK